MTEQEFLSHYQLVRNPFSDEDAQTDSVFRDHCIAGTFHPSWSKVLGDPKQPATSIVFGPKGSGKTAMKLQLKQHIRKHNSEFPSNRVFLVELDDFNAYLGPLQQHLPHRHQSSPDKVLQSLQLWDHMDAILSEAISPIVDRILGIKSSLSSLEQPIDAGALKELDRGQRRDLLLLAAIYDRSPAGTHVDRFKSLKRKLGFWSPAAWTAFFFGCAGSIVVFALCALLYREEILNLKQILWLLPLGILGSWAAYITRLFHNHTLASRIRKHLRVVQRDKSQLRGLLMTFTSKELDEQPLPTSDRSDDRYALLEKLQLLLRSFGYPGLIVIVDRVDEPDLVNGLAERMKLLIWPLLDNKLLKHDHLGIKLLLPSELQYFADRESREFHERARLDKQNVVHSFDWTGEALYDLLGSRMKACSATAGTASPKSLFDSSISETRLIAAFQSLRTPRNLFRFLYRLITEHCKKYRSEAPQFQITSELFETTLALAIAEDRRT